MLKTLLFVPLVLCAVSFEKDGDVLVLTDDNIESAIKENEFILIEFYAPWCGHCKSLAPEYAKAATILSKLDNPIPIAKVDATEETKFATKLGVRGYPTLKWYSNGVASEFNGGRTASEIVSWIKKKTGPAYKTLDSQASLDSFKDGADVVVVGFLEAGSDAFAAFEGAARQSEDVEFAVLASSEVAAQAGASFPSIVLYKKFDEGQAVFDGESTAAAISSFVSANAVPLVSTFSQETAGKIFGSGIDTHFLYFNSESNPTHAASLGVLSAVAKDFKGKTLFVYVPASEERVLTYFDFKASDLPKAILVALGDGDMKKFGFNAELTEENVRSHVSAYHNGDLKPTLKSEDVPESNDGPVKVVVGKNFEDIVLDTTKDVLLEFYAPWCGHCKSLTPVWERLGAKFASSSSVVIAKVDATANDIVHPGVNVRGFPTILFFPANNKNEPVTYEGGRDLDSFVDFLNENASPVAEQGHDHSEL